MRVGIKAVGLLQLLLRRLEHLDLILSTATLLSLFGLEFCGQQCCLLLEKLHRFLQ